MDLKTIKSAKGAARTANRTRNWPEPHSVLREFLRRSCAIFALASVFCFAGFAQDPTLPKRVIGDYGYWSRTQTPPYSSAQIPFQKLTHINHAGASFGSDGSLIVPDGFLEPALIQKAHAAGVKVLLLFGGDWAALEANPELSKTVMANLKPFVAANHYDGFDIDWEYPETPLDKKTFFMFLSGLRDNFPRPDFVLSADVPPWGGADYDFPHVEPLVDYFNIMMYDCAGPWTDDAQLNSPIFPPPNNPQPWECEPGGSVKEAIDIFTGQLNIPPQKLNMGTPFYGYFYVNAPKLFGNCTNCQYTVLGENYGTFIKQRINKNGWKRQFDQAALVPYLLRADGRPGFITYDDATSTFSRVFYSVWQRGLGGSFMWSLDADYDGHSQDLLDAMFNASHKP
jgi:chitinase